MLLEIILVFMCIELMLNSVNLLLAAFGAIAMIQLPVFVSL